MITAIVLAKNEEKNIGECLTGLRWCDEVIVIDDDSTDKTMEIATKTGARVIKHPLNGNFAEQRNFALSKAKNDWVFFVDADERVSEKLAGEIKSLTHSSAIAGQRVISGFYFKRIDCFMGRWLRHGEIGGIAGMGGIKILRMAKKGLGEWKRAVDEKWEIRGKTKTLKNPLYHYSHPNLAQFLESINRRSTINAEEFYSQGKRVTFFEWFKPLVKFVQNYFLKFGFLDGMAGFVFAVLMSLHSFLVRGKLYLLWRRRGGWNE